MWQKIYRTLFPKDSASDELSGPTLRRRVIYTLLLALAFRERRESAACRLQRNPSG
jgi:hypothetical protein